MMCMCMGLVGGVIMWVCMCVSYLHSRKQMSAIDGNHLLVFALTVLHTYVNTNT